MPRYNPYSFDRPQRQNVQLNPPQPQQVVQPQMGATSGVSPFTLGAPNQLVPGSPMFSQFLGAGGGGVGASQFLQSGIPGQNINALVQQGMSPQAAFNALMGGYLSSFFGGQG